MRLPLLFSKLGLVAIGVLAESNLTYFGAPRLYLDPLLPSLDIAEGYIRQSEGIQAAGSSVAAGLCSADNPCVLGSCCSKDGQCGYLPENCSPETCVADCGAKAACGEYSADGETSCPLNACCSHLGFCGFSDAFCHRDAGSGAQIAATAEKPSCGKSSGSASRRVAYYQSWNTRRRACDKVSPSMLDTTGITHLILAFATIDPATFEVKLMNPDDDAIYKEFLALPNPQQKWIGLGGFEFTDEGPTRHTWSDMVSTQENRKKFIDSLKQFLDKWDFKGVDIDWEWPGHPDRGGYSRDGQNQVALMKEMRERVGGGFGLGVVIPAHYDYLKNLDIKGLEASVDWLTILTYDLHGPWDANVPSLGPKIRPHTDLQEIDTALDLLWNSGIDSKKVNMGVANYGRGYTVADKSCMNYGCTYTGPSKQGSCSLQPGVLSICEINRIIGEKNLQPSVIPGGAETNEVTWDDQWMSWDDSNTFGKKAELANDRCLGGTALWALDYSTCPGGGGAPGPGPGPGSSAAPSQSSESRIPSGSPNSSQDGSPTPSPSASPSPSSSEGQPGSPSPSPSPSPPDGSPSASGTAAPPGSPSPSPSATPSGSSASSSEGAPLVSGSATPSPSPSPSDSPAPPGSPSPSASASSSGSDTPASSTSSSASGSPDPTAGPSSNSPGASGSASSSTESSPQGSPGPSSTSTAPGNSPQPGPSSTSSDTPGNSPQPGPSSTSSDTPGNSAQPGPSSTSSDTPGNSAQPGPSSTSSGSPDPTQGPVVIWCPDECKGLPWCKVYCEKELDIIPPPDCWSLGWCRNWLHLPSPSSTSSGSPDPTPGPPAIWCPDECRKHDWCTPFCTKPLDPDPPKECRQFDWCSIWWRLPDPSSSSSSSSETSSSLSSSSETPTPTDGPGAVVPWCPKECKDHEWCKAFCDKELDPVPPHDCWFFDWCMIWWRFPVPKGKKENPKKCKLLGCGCGWMGLPFGPGCNSPKLPFPFDIIIPIFGLFPSPCIFWGCHIGGLPTCGLFGCGGFCFGLEGCTECPKLFCPKGGPEPGPPTSGPLPVPTPKPGEKPKPCEEKDYKVATERGVFCGDYVYLSSAISVSTISTWGETTAVTTSASTTTTCHTAWDFEVQGCDVHDVLTTTTSSVTYSNSISKETPGPACTRAPLSLDDDEGNNIPEEDCQDCWDYFDQTCIPKKCDPKDVEKCAFMCLSDMCLANDSPRYCHKGSKCQHNACPNESMGPLPNYFPVTMTFPSSMSGGGSKATWTLSASSSYKSPSSTSATTTSSSSSTTTTSSASPTPSPMDKNGKWKADIRAWMENDYAKVEWRLFDPNGNEAGVGEMMPVQGKEPLANHITTKNRPKEHQMPFKVQMWMYNPIEIDYARVKFEIDKGMPGCPHRSKARPGDIITVCFPNWETENKSESIAFWVETCWDLCPKDQPEKQLLKPSDVNCDDLNEADWYQEGNAWKRNFSCFWKGF